MTFTRTGTVVGRSLFGYMFELTATETSSVAMFPPSLRTDEDVSTLHHAATKHGPSILGKNGCARSHDCGSDDREEDDVLCSAAVGDSSQVDWRSGLGPGILKVVGSVALVPRHGSYTTSSSCPVLQR